MRKMTKRVEKPMMRKRRATRRSSRVTWRAWRFWTHETISARYDSRSSMKMATRREKKLATHTIQ